MPQDEPDQKEPEVLAKVNVPKPPARENVSIMNASKSLSAARLLEEAVKTLGETLSDDKKAALRDGMKVQSESDMKIFSELSSSMVQNFETVVSAERSVTDELIAAINVLEQRAEDASRQLEREKERAVVDKERALKTQEKKLKAEHVDFLVAERIERIKALDEERIRMGALRQVLTKRREALERAHAVQSFELAVMDFGSRVENGEAFEDALALLNTCAKKDPFIATIIQGLDQDMAKRGVPTRLQLAEQLERVRDTARKLSLVPQDGGGMLAHGLAYAASLLRVKDTSDEGAQGIEGAIAKAETHLANGELMHAAKSLASAAEGTKAATSVTEWAHSVRSRAEVEQAQTALNAHAQCRASALV